MKLILGFRKKGAQNMKFKITTNYLPLTHVIKQDVPGGVSISISPFEERRGVDTATVIQIVVEISKDITIGIVSAWLYDKLKKSPSTKLEYNRREIQITEGEISKIIEESLEPDD
jgi:hypothetical protein